MKKSIFSAFALLFCLFAFAQEPEQMRDPANDLKDVHPVYIDFYPVEKTYGLDPVEKDKKLTFFADQWKKSKTVGGAVMFHGGVTLNHPDAFLGFVGYSNALYIKLLEVNAGYFKSFGSTKYYSDFLMATVGLRFPITNGFVVTTRAGYWTIYNGEDKIQWKGGNRACYGAEISQRVNDRIEVTATWTEFESRRSPRNLQHAHYGDTKIGSIGMKLIL